MSCTEASQNGLWRCVIGHMAVDSCLAIGLISGTSADGIDACVIKIGCKDDGTFSE